MGWIFQNCKSTFAAKILTSYTWEIQYFLRWENSGDHRNFKGCLHRIFATSSIDNLRKQLSCIERSHSYPRTLLTYIVWVTCGSRSTSNLSIKTTFVIRNRDSRLLLLLLFI